MKDRKCTKLKTLKNHFYVLAPRNVLAHVWDYYATRFANNSVKDHVLESIHITFLKLPWRNFTPTLSDLDQMVRIMDTFIPICHGFVGRVFGEIAWFKTVAEQPYGRRMIPGLLRLIVKLAAEPQIRQVKTHLILFCEH